MYNVVFDINCILTISVWARLYISKPICIATHLKRFNAFFSRSPFFVITFVLTSALLSSSPLGSYKMMKKSFFIIHIRIYIYGCIHHHHHHSNNNKSTCSNKIITILHTQKLTLFIISSMLESMSSFSSIKGP